MGMANVVPKPSRLENRARMSFFVDHRKRTSVRGHFSRTSDTTDTPQNAATLDRSSAALLRDEVNRTLATLADSIHGDSGGLYLPHGLNRLNADLSCLADGGVSVVADGVASSN